MGTQSETAPRQTVVHLAVFAAAMLVLVTCWRFTVDDAFIVSRFVRNLAVHGTWGMNPGRPGDGVTSPLFVLMVWPWATLGGDPIVVQKLLGAVAFLLTVQLLTRARLGLLAVLAWIVGPWVMWAAAGLETSLASLMLTWLGQQHRIFRARSLSVAAVSCLVPWVRPELWPLAFGLAWTVAGMNARNARLQLICGHLVVLLMFCGGRSLAFGHPLPLAAYAKLGGIGDGLGYVFRALPSLALVLPLVWAGGLRSRLAFATGVTLVALSGGDWMPGFRLLAPVLACALMLCERPAWVGAQRSVIGTLFVLGAIANLAMCGVAVRGADALQDLRLAGEPLRESLQQCHSVALVDAGFLVHDLDVEVVDLGGLTDRWIAQRPGGHLAKRVSLADLRARRVDCLVLHRTYGRGFIIEEHLRQEITRPVHLSVGSRAYRYDLFRL